MARQTERFLDDDGYRTTGLAHRHPQFYIGFSWAALIALIWSTVESITVLMMLHALLAK
jgi:hypothetical protein